MTGFPRHGRSLYGNDHTWEFDTVRGPVSEALSALVNNDSSEPAPFATVRPSTAKLPTSLRVLFDNDEAAPPDPFRIPGFHGTPRNNAPSPIPTPSAAIAHSRDRSAIKRAMAQNNDSDDGPSLSKATFAFPAANSRARSRMDTHNTGTPDDSWDESNSSFSPSEHHLPLRRPSMSNVSDEMDMSVSAETVQSSPFQTIRDRGTTGHLQSAEDSPPAGETVLPIRTTSIRDESRNSVSSVQSGDHSFTFPQARDFQFPQTPVASTAHERLPESFGSPPGRRTHDRASPTHLSTSSINIPSPISHHPTHSLDMPSSSTISRHQPSSVPSSGPPPLSRARSATPSTDSRAPDYNVAPLAVGFQPPSRKPSLTRLASVAVMETMQTMQMPMTPPVKPFARGRSGSSNSGKSDVVVPGLKDVLKVCYAISINKSRRLMTNPQIPSLSSEHHLGMSDLLPPSPSAVTTNMKVFTATSSNLSNSVTSAEHSHGQSPPNIGVSD